MYNISNSEVVSYTVPNWALPALVNSDYSGLNQEEMTNITAFLSKANGKWGNVNFHMGDPDKDDLGFTHRNDINNMAGNCFLVYLLVDKVKYYIETVYCLQSGNYSANNETKWQGWNRKVFRSEYEAKSFKTKMYGFGFSTQIERHEGYILVFYKAKENHN